MRHNYQNVINSVRKRSGRSRLLTADRYFRDMENCFTGGVCPTRLFESSRPGDWKRALKDAETRLVWSDRAGIVETAEPNKHDVATSSPAILEFDAVITTTRRDRDKDVMESSGADVDPQAVLLWQHVPMLPIGRLVKVTEQSATRVKARLAIADTELGRDAAVLAAFGALKISHGFEPLQYEPLPDDGWHFRKFEIFEVSLVSIPSNRDAVITALRRDKLRSPFMKEWATGLYRTRPVQGRGATLDIDPGANPEVGNASQTVCVCKQHCVEERNASSLTKAAEPFLRAAARCGPAHLPELLEVQRTLDQVVENVEAARRVADTQSLIRALSG
ncbi:MAG: HK97 family phage prohead protease [Planctomycetaceae bacterium]